MLKLSNVTFGYYVNKKVIDNLTLEFAEGGIYGLLGKNGTGKSTLLYLIIGLLRPKSGEVTLEGINTADRTPAVLQEMFIVPEEYNMPSIKLTSYIKALRQFYPNFDEQILKDCLEIFELPMDIQLGDLSMGMKKKVYMCIALAARTKVLLMDEPTNGLDIPAKSQFRKVIAKGMREDQIIIISTHQVRDIELLLDHVTIIDNNKVLKNEAINIEEPVNLEELFLNTLDEHAAKEHAAAKTEENA
ncbi:MAG: ABC transporter ATP-binding protein [Bacteroidaceae bacterium]|jgi:ABC-2 type transport system ATP-binding protein|nr:ABC transporter ATP-binding protein [Bacteroidaceae bacterium]